MIALKYMFCGVMYLYLYISSIYDLLFPSLKGMGSALETLGKCMGNLGQFA